MCMAVAFWHEIRQLDAAVDYFRAENEKLEDQVDRLKKSFKILAAWIRRVEWCKCGDEALKDLVGCFMVSCFEHGYVFNECPSVVASPDGCGSITVRFVELQLDLDFRGRDTIAYSLLDGSRSGTVPFDALLKFEGVAAELFAAAIPPPPPDDE